MLKNVEVCRRIDCVDADVALRLLLLRPVKETRPVYVNIYCDIKCVSEVIQIKDVQLFLVKIQPKLNIICKRKESLHLHERIFPGTGTPVIITNLRHTTLQKGSCFTEAVYSVTKDTEVLTERDIDIRMLTLEEWCKQHGIQYIVNVPDVVTDADLYSYTGTITSILDGRLGVYELDNENRLFLGQVPAVHKYRHLTVGLKIFIHNVHHYTSTQYPKISLYGCMLSSVRVQHNQDFTRKTKYPQTPQVLKNYLYLYQLSYRKLEHLYNICKAVQERFSHLGNGFCDNLIKVILGNDKLSWVQNTSSSYRNHLDEFLVYPHQCYIQHREDKSFPVFVSVKQILNVPMVEQNTEPAWNYTYRPTDTDKVLLGTLDICEKTGMSIFMDMTGQIDVVIAECLVSSSTLDRQTITRHVCSSDCDCSSLEPGDSFTCPYYHTCCVGKIVAITKYGLITEYMTRSRNSLSDGSGVIDARNYIFLSLQDVIYLGSAKKGCLEFNMVDKNRQCNLVRDNKFAKNTLSTRENQEVVLGKVSCDIPIQSRMENSRLVCDSKGKDQTSALHRHQRDDGGVYFCRQTGCNDGTENVEKTNKDSRSMMKQIETKFCSESNEKQLSKSGSSLFSLKPVNHDSDSICVPKAGNVFDIPVKKRRTRNCTDSESVSVSIASNCQENHSENAEDDNQMTTGIEDFSDASWENSCETGIVIIHTKDALVMEGIGENKSARFCIHGQIVQDTSLNQAILLFKGRAAKWYSLIHQGCTYTFSVPAELSPLFQHNVGHAKVMQKLKKHASKLFMVVNESAELEQIYSCPLSVQNDLSSEDSAMIIPRDSPASVFSGVFKDVEGTILSRIYIKGDNLHERSGRLDKICTRIKLKTTDNEVFQIYLKAEDFISPLGLVPGSDVCFSRLERKVSQLGNIYWRFIPLSSVRVITFTQTFSCNISDHGVDNDCKSVIQIHYLRDVWEHKLRDWSDVFMCVCSVQQILKVSLKYVCDHCGSLIRKSTCSNVGCFNTEMGRFIARASILVDDGTSVAMVTMMGDMVRELLGLTVKQWEEIQMEANIQGEIFVQQARPELQSDLERLIYHLCDSPLVKQNWTMKLKTRPVSKYTDLNQMKIEEFGQKTFDTGSGKVTTRCLPFLQLECIHLQTVDPYQICLNLLTL